MDGGTDTTPMTTARRMEGSSQPTARSATTGAL